MRGESASSTARAAYSRLAALRAHLDLPRVRRATGLLGGRHRSVLSGHGQDFDELIEYQPGDDVGDIDWRASAGRALPVMRRFERETNLSMMLAVDTGRSMSVPGVGGTPKSAVAQFACDAMAYLARERGDAVSLVAGDAERLVHLPGRSGTAHMELLLRRVDALLSDPQTAADVARVLRRVETLVGQRRSVIVLITDEAHPAADTERVLRRLRTRHEVVVVRVADAPLAELLEGPVEDVDAVLGLPEYLWRRAEVRAEVEATQASRRDEISRMLRGIGIPEFVCGTEDEVLDGLMRLFARRRRGRT